MLSFSRAEALERTSRVWHKQLMSARPYPIRRLGPNDLALMRRLNAMFGAAFMEPETYRVDPPDDDWLRRALAQACAIVLAALDGDEPVGGLVAYELDKFEQPRREIYLYDLAVAAAHRRRRIATRLIEALREIALARGAATIFVQADYGDDAAIALYQGLGAREDVIHFDIAVGPKRR
jgi:aminoglycoside 3-N-acetyltransferase I